MLKTSHVAVAANKGIKAQELLHQWTANDHVMVKQHTAYRVKDRITREADSTYELDHQRIMPYLLELQRLRGLTLAQLLISNVNRTRRIQRS